MVAASPRYTALATPITRDQPTNLPSSNVAPASVSPTTSLAQDIRLSLVTSHQSLGVIWSSDGKIFRYAEKVDSIEHGNGYRWYAYFMGSGERTLTEPPTNVSQDLWDKLESAPPNPEDNLWFQGSVSPSQQNIVYLRVQPGYLSPTNITQGPYVPPMELWIASIDGNKPTQLGDVSGCLSLYRAIWLDNEHKVIIACSGEAGPPSLYMADIIQRSLKAFSEITAYTGYAYGNFALSPDETKLAVPAEYIQLIPLDGGPIESIAQGGSEPNWSTDGQRLYYQKSVQFSMLSCQIRVYDFHTKTDSLVLESPISTSDGQQIPMLCGHLSMSPQANAAVFFSRGLWLAQWSVK
jgi:hypothetical protein